MLRPEDAWPEDPPPVFPMPGASLPFRLAVEDEDDDEDEDELASAMTNLLAR